MNKVILMGRLTRDPEVRLPQGGQSTAVCRYTIAVDRSYKRDGEPTADFINIVVFGKRAEFAGNYFKKGMKIAVIGELRIRSYEDREGQRRWVTEVVASEQHFAESRAASESSREEYGARPNNQPASYQAPAGGRNDGFIPVTVPDDDDLPF